MVDHYSRLAKSGVMSHGAAQTAAKDAVRHTRFVDRNYFWIQGNLAGCSAKITRSS